MADFIHGGALSATQRRAALNRIGLYQTRGRSQEKHLDRRLLLNWFVKVAFEQRPLSERADVEVELLAHEYRALQEELLDLAEPVQASVLEQFRSVIRERLEELADEGRTSFGPFTITRTICRSMPSPDGKPAALSAVVVEQGEGQGLIHYLSELLERDELVVFRCPGCEGIRVQPRTDARFCSRQCQANAYARKQRQRKQMKAQNKEGKGKQTSLRAGRRKRGVREGS